jgi:hypothetical protein
MVARPPACRAFSGAAQPSISYWSFLLLSGCHGTGVVLYTPAEYLLMMPFAPTNPNDPGRVRARRTVSAMACIEQLLPAPPKNGSRR